MVETRGAHRYRVTKPAQIEYGNDKSTCMLRDISTTGAALEVSDPAIIPAKFTLVLAEEGLKLPCTVVRRAGFRIGVAFD
jgi:PilZ domain